MSDKSSSSGIGFFGMLAILFIGLKLANVISWSWFWILSPIFGALGIFIIFFIVLLIIGIYGK